MNQLELTRNFLYLANSHSDIYLNVENSHCINLSYLLMNIHLYVVDIISMR